MSVVLLWSPLALSLWLSIAMLQGGRTRELEFVSERRPTSPSIAIGLGTLLHKLLKRPSTRSGDRRLGRIVLGGAVLAVLSPVLAVVSMIGCYAASVMGQRRRARAETETLMRGLGEVIDLFAMALSSGHTTAAALEQAAVWAPPPFADSFARCVEEVTFGRPLSEVLEGVPDRLGKQTRALVGALVAHDRYGAPIVHNLSQLAADARSDHRRRAESAARRLPVTLLFPLVVCVLPAFLLLTVVPVLAETLTAFDLSASP